jgi:hypothetical protein
MTATFNSRFPGAEVRDVTIVTRDDGTNRRARLGLTYAVGRGPETVFLKAHDPRHRLVHLRNGNLFGEARLFASGVPLAVDHPVVYTSIVDRLRLDFLLMMEDLIARGADPRDATRPMTVDQVANGVRGLARLHSQYWGFSRRTEPRLRWVKTWEPTKGWQVGLRKRVPTGLERAVGSVPAEVARYTGDEIVDLWVRFVATLRTGPMTLLHGDAHIGNTYVLALWGVPTSIKLRAAPVSRRTPHDDRRRRDRRRQAPVQPLEDALRAADPRALIPSGFRRPVN